MSDPESHAEKLARVQAMADDDGDTWDLSQNDKAALIELLVHVERLEQQLLTAESRGRTAQEAERTVASIAAMLGWMNVPPSETLERDINALKARAQESANAASRGRAAGLREAADLASKWADTSDRVNVPVLRLADSLRALASEADTPEPR